MKDVRDSGRGRGGEGQGLVHKERGLSRMRGRRGEEGVREEA